MSILDKIKRARAAASAALKSDMETEPRDPKAPFRTVDEIMAAMRERTGLDRELTTIGAHRQFVFSENRTPDEKRIIEGWLNRIICELSVKEAGDAAINGAYHFFVSLKNAIEPVSKKSIRVDELDGQIFESMAKIEQYKISDSQSGIEADIIRKPKYYFLAEHKQRVIELLIALGHESVVKTEPDIDTGNARSFGAFHKTYDDYFREIIENDAYDQVVVEPDPKDPEKKNRYIANIKELAEITKKCTITTAKNYKKIK